MQQGQSYFPPLVRTRINLSDFTAQHHSAARSCFPPTASSGNVFENYGKAELVGGSVSDLTKDFVIVTF